MLPLPAWKSRTQPLNAIKQDAKSEQNEKKTDSLLLIHDSTFNNNTAVMHGGVVSVADNQQDNVVQVILSQCNFIGNTAGNNGGVLQGINLKQIKILKCIFKNNRARKFGGALHLSGRASCTGKNDYHLYNTSVVVVESHFYGNQATDGAILTCYYAMDISLDTCIIKNNRAPSKVVMHFGSVLFVRTAKVVFSDENSDVIFMDFYRMSTQRFVTVYLTLGTEFTRRNSSVLSSIDYFLTEGESSNLIRVNQGSYDKTYKFIHMKSFYASG